MTARNGMQTSQVSEANRGARFSVLRRASARRRPAQPEGRASTLKRAPHHAGLRRSLARIWWAALMLPAVAAAQDIPLDLFSSLTTKAAEHVEINLDGG